MSVSIETGSIAKFYTSTTPVGWTKITTYDNYMIRIVNGTVSSGGSRDFSTVFTPQPVSGSVNMGTLSLNPTVAGSPSHTHGYNYYVSGTFQSVPSSFTPYSTVNAFGPAGPTLASTATGGGQGHGHPVGSVSPVPLTNTLSMSVKYVDAIVAQRG